MPATRLPLLRGTAKGDLPADNLAIFSPSSLDKAVVLLINQKDYEHFNQVLVEIGRIGVYDDGKNSKSRPAAFRRKQDAGRVEGTQKRRIDALAAAEILQAFLDSKKA